MPSSFFTPTNITLAYHKAKADAFFESGHLNLTNFAEFENDLEASLTSVRQLFRKWDGDFDDDFCGTAEFILKDCKEKPDDNTFVFFSDVQRNWKRIGDLDEVEVRLIGHHPVPFHILSSLWIEKVGLELDRQSSQHSYGCRLRPIDENDTEVIKQKESRLAGHFRPYFHDYQSWQHNGIDAIQKAINDGKKIVAITADIKKFYHSIDPEFLISNDFQNYFSLNWSLDQLQLTVMLCEAIKTWGKQVEPRYRNNGLPGIPIGLGASKVIANALLAYLDRQIAREVQPVYYGRYVDDVFLVLEDNGTISNRVDLWDFLAKRIPALNFDRFEGGAPTLNIPYGEQSSIEFGIGKEKIFLLEGTSGASFIETLKDTLEENSSEWKLLPDTEDDLDEFAKEMAKPTYNLQEAANGLRKADGISIQRLKFALQLRNFESIVELLPKKLWIVGLQTFLKISKDFTLAPAKIGTFAKYFPRLIRIAVRANEPELAQDIFLEIEKSWQHLSNKAPKNAKQGVSHAKDYNDRLILEALCTAINPLKRYTTKQWKSLFDLMEISASVLQRRAISFFLADLHAIPYKKIFFDPQLKAKFWFNEDVNRKTLINVETENPYFKRLRLERYYEFVQAIDRSDYHWEGEALVPIGLVFYTRPPSMLEMTFLFQDWATEPTKFKHLQKMLRVFNIPALEADIEVKNAYDKGTDDNEPPLVTVNVPDHFRELNRTIALTSFLTNEMSWKALVRDDDFEPDLQRYARLFKLLNDIIRLDKLTIQYLVFPELSIPRDVLLFIALKLKSKKISLIAGAEYEKHSRTVAHGKGAVSNQLIYVLTAKAGPFTEQVIVVQEKTVPAIGEERDLYDVGGKILVPRSHHKFLINHAGFYFSGLICNDLLNIDNRSSLRGLIDALIVIEWNKDTETYDSLVTSAANDLHCFVVQVNNRLYGDTRLRAPYKEAYLRDKVRVRGGELDYFVVSSLDIKALREFQRDYRSPEKPFKPIPTGYKMSPERRKKG